MKHVMPQYLTKRLKINHTDNHDQSSDRPQIAIEIGKIHFHGLPGRLADKALAAFEQELTTLIETHGIDTHTLSSPRLTCKLPPALSAEKLGRKLAQAIFARLS